MDKETKSLDISVAFPQATPSSIFPPSVSDYYQLYELFTPEEQAIGKKVRDFMETEVAPIMSKYWEKAEFPVQLIPKLAALHIAGGTVKGYGCSGLSMGANAIAAIETARVDASFTTFVGVHAHLAVRAIGLFGSEAQKQKYLPSLAEFKAIACWAMTEPDHGSNITTLKTTARKVEGGWILEGQKRWIGNGTLADIMIVCAKNIETNQLNGFIVKKGTPGLQATKIENKIGLRITQNADILLKNVFVPDEDKLPGVNSARDFIKVLPFMRTMICWQAVGISMGAYDMCHRYLRERQQFGAPLAAFQINQEKLVRMLGNIQAMFLMAWRITTLIESGNITVGRVSMCKAWVTLRGRENVSLARELLGGNGIVSDFHVAKAFCDMEALYTYEGTYDLTTLTTGKEVTGISSLRPPPSSKRSRL